MRNQFVRVVGYSFCRSNVRFFSTHLSSQSAHISFSICCRGSKEPSDWYGSIDKRIVSLRRFYWVPNKLIGLFTLGFFEYLIPLFHTGHESPESPRIYFFLLGGGGIREVSLIFFLQSWWATSHSRFRYDVVTNIRGNRLNSAGIAQEFITIRK